MKLIINSLYGEQIKRNIEEKFARKSEYWMMSEYDEIVKVFWKRLLRSNLFFLTSFKHLVDTEQ